MSCLLFCLGLPVPAGRGLKKAVALKQGKWLTIFGYFTWYCPTQARYRYCGFETILEINRFFCCLFLAGVYFCGFAIFCVLLEIDFCDFQTVPVPSIDNMFVIFGNLFLRIAGKIGAKSTKIQKVMIDWGWLSHIPLLSYVPTNLNCVYFNLNFCIENWQQTISFLRLESNLMINAVSVKKARKLFSIKFVFGFYVGFGEICEKFYLSFCLLLPALIHFLRRKNNQKQIAHLSCLF